MYYIIFKNGSYIIADNVVNGSLTWTIRKENIIETQGDIEIFSTSNKFNCYSFAKFEIIRGVSDLENIFQNMIRVLFSHGFMKQRM